jgi:hypothetical protein
MDKPAPTPAKPTAKRPAADTTAPFAELPMPTTGGSYIRQPDGSLAPDTTQQAAAPAQEQAP